MIFIVSWHPNAPATNLLSNLDDGERDRDAYASFMQQHPISACVETFTKARQLVPSPDFDSDRLEALEGLRTELEKGSIDEPTIDVVERFASLPCCYTLQSCYGHFVSGPFTKDTNTKRVADIKVRGNRLHYRIAYIAFCIQNSAGGRALLRGLRSTAEIDPGYIQFGSAEWFWKTCVNSYVLQVSPLKSAHKDHFYVDLAEAVRIEQARDKFFDGLRGVLSKI